MCPVLWAFQHLIQMSLPYQINEQYTRADIYSILGVEGGGDWLNGYHKEGNDIYIFCGVGVAGRTGHDYDNHWEGETLVWYGKNQTHFRQPSVQRFLSGAYRSLVFWRAGDRDPFTFAGIGTPLPHLDTSDPVRIDWHFAARSGDALLPGELPESSTRQEGSVRKVLVNRYERDRSARNKCIEHHGVSCAVCSFDFKETYGSVGKDFIHVHHLVPISSVGEDYQVDPIADLIPVCPNCHAMLHKRRDRPYDIQELRNLMDIASEGSNNPDL